MGEQKLRRYNEIVVDSIDEIYQLIDKYNKDYAMPRIGGNTEVRAFYRGQADSSWNIEPSIVRCTVNEREQYLNNQFKLKGKDLFEQFAYLQHYMPGTRLIDFTKNHNVALYFACSSNPLTDGAMYIYSYASHRAEWVDTIIFTEIMQMDEEGVIKIKDFSEMLYQKYEIVRIKYSSISELSMNLMAYLDHGYMVYPSKESKKNNIRLMNQQGVFYICGVKFVKPITSEMRLETRAGDNEFICHSVQVPNLERWGRSLVKVIINVRLKPLILEHLEKIGITEEYLFPDKK